MKKYVNMYTTTIFSLLKYELVLAVHIKSKRITMTDLNHLKLYIIRLALYITLVELFSCDSLIFLQLSFFNFIYVIWSPKKYRFNGNKL